MPSRRLGIVLLLALALLAVADRGVAAAKSTHHRNAPTCGYIHWRLAHHLPLRTQRARAKAVRCQRAHRLAVLRRIRQQSLAVQPMPNPAPASPSAPVAPSIAPVAGAAATPTVPPVKSPTPPITSSPVKPPKPPTTPPPVVTPPPPVTPPADPPPGTPGSTEGWNGFGAGSWPEADWRPYSASSPFNQTIPATAVAHPSSAQIVQTVLSWDLPGSLVAGSAGTSNDYGHPTYYSLPSDPIYTLHATGSTNPIEGMRIPVPAEAEPAGGGDGHMTIVTPDGWEYDLWQVQSKPDGGGTLTFAIGGRTRIDGTGLGSPATASNFANIAGVIRAQELAAGEIDHALFIVAKCTSTGTTFGFGTKAGTGDQAAYVYPASHGGAGCGGADNATAPPMGARFQLAMTDAQIAALNVPDWKKTIARALAHYGGYVGDTGGPGFGLQFESSTMYTVFGEPDPLVEFAQDSGIRPSNGLYAFNLATGIDWAHYLRVVPPPGS